MTQPTPAGRAARKTPSVRMGSGIRQYGVALLAAACSTSVASHPPKHDSSGVDAAILDSALDGNADRGGSAPAEPPIFKLDAGRKGPRDAGDASSICAAEVHRAEQLQLDMLVVMDGSGSMADEVAGGPKWALVVTALGAFVDDPASTGIGVGLTYFGIPAGYDAGDLVVSCNVADYAEPAVAIGGLPANAKALLGSLTAYMPQGGTPTRPALEGAVDYAHRWLAQHPTHRMVIVVATDGEPNDCDSTVDAVSAIATAAAGERPSISTYVIGVGSSLANLDQIATAGGTKSAFVVDTSQSTTANFAAAMNAIRGEAALPCRYELPSTSGGRPLDYGLVNVARASGADAGRGGTLAQVPDRASCDPTNGGWYYDDPTTPTSINLCDATCESVKRDPTGVVQVLIGCKTETRVVR